VIAARRRRALNSSGVIGVNAITEWFEGGEKREGFAFCGRGGVRATARTRRRWNGGNCGERWESWDMRMREEREEVKREEGKEEPSVSAFENWVAGLVGKSGGACSRTQKKAPRFGPRGWENKVDD